MSRIDDLIAEFCPDGVEFMRLGDVCLKTANISWVANRNLSFQYIDLTSVDRVTHSIGDIETINSDNAPSRAQKIVKANDVIFGTTRPTLKRYCFIPTDIDGQICSTGYCVLRADETQILPRYIYHLISSTEFDTYVEVNQRGSAYPAISDADVKAYNIPIPPLPVQQEIVRVLDKFTELEAELEAKLKIELEVRKQQYEYYRNKLLAFGSEFENTTIGEVFDMKAGKGIQTSEIYSVKCDEFAFPCYGGNGLRGYVKKPSHFGEYVIIGRQGALCGNVKRVTGEFYATEHAVVVTAKPGININWAFYILNAMNLNQYATKSAQPGLSVGKIDTLSISIPSLAEQERIVAILDRFDALVNDITQGLPAEIAARHQQYEHYRDQLLTFKEKSL